MSSRVPSEQGADNPPPTDEKPLDDVCHDRNLLAIAFARAMWLTCRLDTADWYCHDDWPVIGVDTPDGQKSWHTRSRGCPQALATRQAWADLRLRWPLKDAEELPTGPLPHSILLMTERIESSGR